MNGIRVEEFNIYSLGAEAVSYHLKNIHTLALQVTRENIGGLCLELQTELQYTPTGEPFLNIYAARGPKTDPESDRNLVILPGSWLVILWDELHLFRDLEFRSTFSFDGLEEMKKYAEKDVKDTETIFKPSTASDKVSHQLGKWEEVRKDPKPWDQVRDEIEDGGTKIIPKVGDIFEENKEAPPGPRSDVALGGEAVISTSDGGNQRGVGN